MILFDVVGVALVDCFRDRGVEGGELVFGGCGRCVFDEVGQFASAFAELVALSSQVADAFPARLFAEGAVLEGGEVSVDLALMLASSASMLVISV
jgi:hypothetical protein